MFQDHCGALPYMTEMVGYKGPIYMTHPTKAIAPILLEDMRKVAVERKGETNFFTSAMIRECMKKVVAVNLHQVGECWKTFFFRRILLRFFSLSQICRQDSYFRFK